MRSKPWSSERVGLLRKLWAEGVTAAAIAAQLGGVSRSGVLGKVHRLRLGPPGGETCRYGGASSPQRRDSGRPPKPPQAEKRSAKTLLELDNQSCRWPLGEPGTSRFRYCGEPGADLENGVPYCEQHMRRAFVHRAKTAVATAAADEPRRAGKTRSPSIVPAAKQRVVAKTLRRRA